tara:strand:+ start:314 stop:547 length:234 start_codon:yes stop_codon:yes gene_type:complete
MIKLHPETAQAIAELINTIDVAVLIRAGTNDTDKCCYWMSEEFKAIITLTEDYGIPHSTYDLAVESMKKDMYANASL